MPMPNTVQPRRSRDAARSTAGILAAAQTEFAHNGFAGARVDRIAEASGTNKALLFQRFGDKKGLYRSVLEKTRSDATASRSGITDAVTSTRPRSATEFHASVRAIVAANIAFLDSHSAAREILNWERADRWATFRELGMLADDGSGAGLLALFEDAMSRGWIRPFPSAATQLAMTFDVPHSHYASLTRTGAVLSADERSFLAEFVADGLVAAERNPER